MPAMLGKVVVMDGRGLNRFAETQDLNDFDVLDTFIYNPGTPFNPADAAEPQSSTNPGIPTVDRQIALSYANFDAFSETTPAGAPARRWRTTRSSARIPSAPPPARRSPTSRASRSPAAPRRPKGNWLLDTGAGASFISRAQAAALGVQYAPGRGPGDPLPEPAPTRCWSTATATRSRTSSRSASPPSAPTTPATPTTPARSRSPASTSTPCSSARWRAAAGNDADDNHLNFIGAPVLVFDISVFRDLPGGGTQQITLDGILGMNFFAASAIPIESIFDPFVTTPGAFDWLVYDEAAGTFGVTLVPEPSTGVVLLTAACGIALRRRRTRR